MTKSLTMGKDLRLPLEAVTEVLGFLGRRGQGKSYAAQKLAEEMHAAGAQFVVLDPVGNWWGLRLAANGKDPGIPIPVLGGLHGDVPLEPTAGKVVADLVADRGISVILDVSQFESDAAKARFAQDFGARFYYRRKQAPAAVHVFLEEAQEFVPQHPVGEEAKMLHAWQRLAKLGRNFGIGVSLLSQRPQEVHKKVLNLAELLLVFQLAGKHERKAVAEWIRDKAIEEDIDQELPRLRRGQPHAWSPAWLQISEVVHVGEKWTFDASSTPKVGKSTASSRPLGPIDLEQLRTDMAATIERAQAEDPKALQQALASERRRIRELERQLEARPAATETVEVPVVPEETVAEFRRVAEVLTGRADGMREAATVVAGAVEQLVGALDRVRNGRPETVRARAGAVPPRAPARPRPSSPRGTARHSSLPKGERIILTAIAQYPDGAARDQLSVLTGYKRSSRDTYIQRLKEKGLVDQAGDQLLATDDGVAALGPDFEPLPTGDALRAYWLERLPAGERAVLEVLIELYPAPVERSFLDERTGYKRSSRDTYIQRLASRRLVVTEGRGQVRASEDLFG